MTIAANPIRPARGLAIFDYVLLRAVINLVVLFGAYIALQIGVSLIVHRLPAAYHDIALLIGFAALSALMFVLYWVLVRLFERRRAHELALAPSLAFGGMVLGALLFCTLYLALWSLGVAQWKGLSGDSKLLVPLAIALGAAFGEELAFRGGVFRVLEDGFGTAVALIVSAVLFGLVHALNAGATPVSTAAIALEAGVFLGLAYAATRSLWLPIGLHFGWNFSEGGIFGASVSGRPYHGLFGFSLSGPDILTGGAFGPEASVIRCHFARCVSRPCVRRRAQGPLEAFFRPMARIGDRRHFSTCSGGCAADQLQRRIPPRARAARMNLPPPCIVERRFRRFRRCKARTESILRSAR